MKSKPKIMSRKKLLPKKKKNPHQLDRSRANQHPWLLYLAVSVSNPSLSSYEKRKGKQSCIPLERNSCHKLSGHLPWPVEGSRDRCGKTPSIILWVGHWTCSRVTASGTLLTTVPVQRVCRQCCNSNYLPGSGAQSKETTVASRFFTHMLVSSCFVSGQGCSWQFKLPQ